jgi:hypothetical protein
MVGLFALALLATGCASKPIWKSEPASQETKNAYFNADISPIFIFDGYKGFNLKIHNKTAGNLEIDWAKTYYVHKGDKNGTFEGGTYEDRKDPKTRDIVSANSTFTKEIFPRILTYYSSLAKSWVHEAMKPGENGVSLTVLVDGKEVTEELALSFVEETAK